MLRVRRLAIALPFLLGAAAPRASAQQPPDPLAPVTVAMAAAERALADDERQIAESRYRDALYAGWMVVGATASADGRFKDARDAFSHASTAIVDSGDALQSLAMVDLRLDDGEAAVKILTKLVAAHPRDAALHRLLAQALVAARQPEEAVQILVEAHGTAPDDMETAFALATGYLRVNKMDAAHALFEQLAAARPRAETYVLIGRAYRDAGRYEEARVALRKALTMNPRVRHAHYYLGTAAVMQEGVVRVEEAIGEFQKELAIEPGDPAASLLLGMAFVEAHRDREALPFLKEVAARPGAGTREYQYLGRCELALGNPQGAVDAFRKALATAPAVPTESQLGNLHYQLAQALRAAGDADAATSEFAIAAASAADRADTRRDTLERYLTEDGDAPGASMPAFSLDAGATMRLTPEERATLVQRVRTALARAYMNLGIMQAQESQFARASDLLRSAADLDPSLPRLQYSLGVACFNAQQFGPAAAALERALVDDPGNADARRMLALASLNTQAFARAAELLKADPETARNPTLQYAYGVALVHSGQAAQAESLFSSLLSTHADNPELNVLLGEAHAEQGDFDGAVAALQRAITLKPDVADANRTLGVIYMKQGKLADAAASLRAELKSHPDDVVARYTLATVLEMNGSQGEAIDELSRVLQARPADADARYLMGKILLERGSAADAVEHLEIAARLAPRDANVHYQLGQAYQKLGRGAEAKKEFDRVQELKAERRGGSE
ncbi:MAG TPA: tetratricopeptide repeat protein [Vicinamibacterales bacterium]|jgi:tetratricopeptide (TPR) repeat protein|nr:tetratricopeptide repeat protein [Vicinamibacterales bacterium]